MNSAIPIQGTLRVWHHESSPLRSPRDSDSTPRQWQRAKVVEGQQAQTALALQQLQRDVNRLRMRPQGGVQTGGFPFEIYQNGTWLEWAVRTGYVVETGNPWVPAEVDSTFTLTSGVPFYWLWLDVEAQEVKQSDTVLEWTAKVIPIGWVDTDTGSATETATAVNLINWHIATLCP